MLLWTQLDRQNKAEGNVMLTYWLQTILLHGFRAKRLEKSLVYLNNAC